MRIIGGKHRSRVLAEFKGTNVRPTSDRTKEALFNILGTKVLGARVLDLFCGSGSLGLECISRGAKEVCFNDASKASVALVKENLSRLKEQGNVSHMDFSQRLLAERGAFDLIFLDPPYAEEFGYKALCLIAQKELLAKNGIVVYERDRAFDKEVQGLVLFDERKYGKSVLSFFQKEENE